jgi:hypothetical protein
MISKTHLGSGTVAHTYNSSYSEVEIRRIMVGGQLSKNVMETPISTKQLDMVV